MSSPINVCKSEFHDFFPSAYKRIIWDFSKANDSAISQAVNCVDWNSEIKRIILFKAKIYQRYVNHDRSIVDYQILLDITSRCKSAIKVPLITSHV